jgi:putative MFS transporter
MTSIRHIDKAVLFTILVAALGYFVDIFDLLLFSIVRVQSLKDLGVAPDQILSVGIRLINTQMAGLLVGGFLWGIVGDRAGRVKVLFGSILLYSVANIANGFAHTVDQYAALRFIAGVGLAGELGAGVTLASELLPQKYRGLGTAFIAVIGILGATVAVLIAALTDWRTAYIVGGCMGLALLVMRVQAKESALHEQLASKGPDIARGDLRIFFRKPELLRRLLAVILMGGPIWGVIGMLITFTPEFAKAFGMSVLPTAANAILFCYIGNSAGAGFTGLLSQKLQSRKKSVAVSLLLLCIAVALYMTVPHADSVRYYYAVCLFLGFATGYWAMFVQIGAEQFGTNIRATAATSAPNFVRALTIPITISFHSLSPILGVAGSGSVVMSVLIIVAFIALSRLKETFGADLDYVES